MGDERVTIFGELAKAGKGILQEAGHQIFGSGTQTPQERSGTVVHNHYHIYPDKKKPPHR